VSIRSRSSACSRLVSTERPHRNLTVPRNRGRSGLPTAVVSQRVLGTFAHPPVLKFPSHPGSNSRIGQPCSGPLAVQGENDERIGKALVAALRCSLCPACASPAPGAEGQHAHGVVSFPLRTSHGRGA